MTDIEAKALALVNEVQADWNYLLGSLAFKRDRDVFSEALCRAIEQHEAFKQEVSDAAERYNEAAAPRGWEGFDRFIIRKPDPLAEVLIDTFGASLIDADELRAALEAHGLEIREKGQ
jgi:hypothetical protein